MIETFHVPIIINRCDNYFRASGENSEDPATSQANGSDMDEEYLDCGKSVNFTYYDNLVGVQRRQRHPNVPEPQVTLS